MAQQASPVQDALPEHPDEYETDDPLTSNLDELRIEWLSAEMAGTEEQE